MKSHELPCREVGSFVTPSLDAGAQQVHHTDHLQLFETRSVREGQVDRSHTGHDTNPGGQRPAPGATT